MENAPKHDIVNLQECRSQEPMDIAKPKSILSQFAVIVENTDVFMGFAAMAILMVMIIPIPSFLLDILLSFNITFALIILLVGMYVFKPLDFSSFPSILLLATLFRLSLNVASTRLILLHGNDGAQAAGKVINAFGNFVVGGNYIVGVIVFLILVIINFMVITKGAGRIAEVAARFTLDAMPGKQMSIDADLNAGLIDDQEARERRQLIAMEAEYYGAMDGANKFVRGDAIAGIIITLINIIAGFTIGVFQNQMSLGEAAQNYTLLTVGDGLVSQIPALIISTAAGIVVSRGGNENGLGIAIGSQLLMQPRAIAVSAAILIALGLIPGLPTVPFFLLGSIAAIIAYLVVQTERLHRREEQADEEMQAQAAEAQPAELLKPLPPLDILSLEVGYGLIPLVDVDQGGELLERIKSIRRQIANEIGIIVPSIHIQDNMQLKPGQYLIRLKGIEIARGELTLGSYLAMDPGTAQGTIDGVATKEPTYGLDAYWIKKENREDAMSKGYTVVDLATVLTTHLSDVIRRHAPELLGRQEVQKLLDTLKESHPKVVEELVPALLSLGGVLKVLQNLLAEQVPVRDFVTILESLADWAPSIKQIDILTEYVRQALSRTITSQYVGPEESLSVITLDRRVEKKIAESVQPSDQGSYLAMDPLLANRIMNDLAGKLEGFANLNTQPLILCSAQIRPHFKRLVDRFIPNLVVLSYDEVVSTVKIHSIGTLELSDAD
jgi:flagellar biosynthesis protein FlhA